MKGQRNRLTEDDIYECSCGEMWWNWEGHGPGGPTSHVSSHWQRELDL